MGESNPIITISLAHGGEIKIELYPKIAPNTVNNFISLASKGFYDSLTFHRIIMGFAIQGGDPDGDGLGGPGYYIRGEFSNNGFDNPLTHEAGVVSMARALSYDTAGSQFFIILKDSFHMDGEYAAFGKVIEGMDVVCGLAEVEVDVALRPIEEQTIYKVEVETFGVAYPEPEKL